MIGDKLLVREHHKKISEIIFKTIKNELSTKLAQGGKYTVSVAGESGSGKSETACELKNILMANGIKTEILSQDDYFVFPPKTNHNMRLNNIAQVGLYEIKLDLIDANLFDFKNGVSHIYKPLINYDEDIITYETIDISQFKVLITEGTYTTSLKFIDKRVFIDRTFYDTKTDRIERSREKFDTFIEKILETEHQIIHAHKKSADIIIKPDFSDIEIKK